MMNRTTALVMLSGGLDSATCLYWAKKNFSEISVITFNYYNRLENEKRAAVELARRVNIVNFLEINIPFIKEFSDFYNGNHPTPGYDGRLASYVPARNLIFYSIAAHYAEFLNIKWIIGGHNIHDGTFFVDATKDYIENLNLLIKRGCLFCNDDPCMILVPLAEMDRKTIINLAIELNVPIELTWSCHSNKAKTHCGQCYACIQRIEAFSSLGIKDPVFFNNK
jgi:7-cyano-7-deazaguanine synthase